MFTDYQLLDLLTDVVDKNLLVYDPQNGETLTRRLIYYMKKNEPTLTHIFAESQAFAEFIPDDWRGAHVIYLYGIEIVFDDRLEHPFDRSDFGGIIYQWYELLGGHFPENCKALTLGINEHDIDKNILGTY